MLKSGIVQDMIGKRIAFLNGVFSLHYIDITDRNGSFITAKTAKDFGGLCAIPVLFVQQIHYVSICPFSAGRFSSVTQKNTSRFCWVWKCDYTVSKESR